jgi:hypothetical protein
MSTTSSLSSSQTASGLPGPTGGPIVRQRDIRLDFFRGIGMFIIFAAHMPYNSWNDFIPARFGFSDATEIFVFCSGMASAIAFGSLFETRGFAIGIARIAFRCWQVYWAHICNFLLIAGAMVVADTALRTGGAYVKGLNLVPFLFGDTGTNLVGLLTLTYVPNYFDILPMYLAILAMVPVVMALNRIGRLYTFAAIISLWFFATNGWIRLPAEPWSDRVWFFNPFAWQLVFFTGFAFIRGWLPAPPVDRRLMIAAVVVIVAVVPFHHVFFLNNFPQLAEARAALGLLVDKTGLGALRFLHFLCLAYLAYALAGPNGANLEAFAGPVRRTICKVGQQALGVFLAGQTLAMLGGVFLNELGHTFFNTAFVNLAGYAMLILVAHTAAYFKSAPWVNASNKIAASAPIAGGKALGPSSEKPRVGQPAE